MKLSDLDYNSYYKCYTADSCKKTGLLMFGSKELPKTEYEKYADKWMSKSRCKQIKKPITEDEIPVAFYRVQHGYTALYDRSEEK